MIRLLLILHLLFASLFGYQYNRFLLKAQIELYPKILLFEKNLLHAPDNKINFAIVYDPIDRFTAQMIYKMMKEKYTMIGENRFVPTVVNVKSFDTRKKEYDAIYVLKLHKDVASKIAQKSLENFILSFVYDVSDLRYGFVIGADIEKDIVIYINKRALLKGHFQFIDSFYQIVRFVENE